MGLHKFKCNTCSQEHLVFTDEILSYKPHCCDDPVLEIQPKEVTTVGITTHPASMHKQYDKLESRRKWVREDLVRAEEESDNNAFHESVKNK